MVMNIERVCDLAEVETLRGTSVALGLEFAAISSNGREDVLALLADEVLQASLERTRKRTSGQSRCKQEPREQSFCEPRERPDQGEGETAIPDRSDPPGTKTIPAASP